MRESREISFAPGMSDGALFEQIRHQGKEYVRLMSYYSAAMLEVEAVARAGWIGDQHIQFSVVPTLKPSL